VKKISFSSRYINAEELRVICPLLGVLHKLDLIGVTTARGSSPHYKIGIVYNTDGTK
jgi:hypothetical protein